jgi:polygalacturonase
VDVRDYGALGDGTIDDRSAFIAADKAAAGREILVPSGSYFIGRSLTLHAPVSFEGTLSMAEKSVR